jgi:hypothetical protein
MEYKKNPISEDKDWGRSEWTAVCIIFTLLLLYPLMNGYPFIFYDSGAYGFGQFRYMEARSPVLSFFLRPVFIIAGTWGYVIFQSAITAFMLIIFQRRFFKTTPIYLLIAAILLSWLGLFSGFLMSEIWVIIGMLALFWILHNPYSLWAAILLSFSMATHLGNLPIFLSVAVIFGFSVKVNRKALLIVFICFFCGIILIATLNLANGRFQIGSKHSYIILASRILHDIPDVLRVKCQEDPKFEMCSYQDEIISVSQRDYAGLIWDEESPLRTGELKAENLSHLSKKLIFYSIKQFTKENFFTVFKNTASMFFSYEIAHGFGNYPMTVKFIKRYAPDDIVQYEDAWQQRGRIYSMLRKAEKPMTIIYIIMIMICIIHSIYGIIKKRKDVLFTFALFSFIAVFINDLFMSNLSGIYGRYHTRICFLPVLSAIVILYYLIRQGFSYLNINRKNP